MHMAGFKNRRNYCLCLADQDTTPLSIAIVLANIIMGKSVGFASFFPMPDACYMNEVKL